MTGSSAQAGPSSSKAAARSGGTKGLSVAQQEALQKAAELKQMLNGLEKVDDEGRRGSLLEYEVFKTCLAHTDYIINS
jgi:SWI/SNF-related matrix-associated actin-dependent regulator of chromatin subfamily A3